jgi:hypothetical protein
MEWWVFALVWLSCTVGCLLVGERQGKPWRALAFGLLFGPAALAVVLADDRSHPGPVVRTAWFAWVCLTGGQVLSVTGCACSILAAAWALLRLAEFGPRSIGTPSAWSEAEPGLVVLSALVGFLYHAGLWIVFSWVKRSILGSLAEPGANAGRGGT